MRRSGEGATEGSNGSSVGQAVDGSHVSPAASKPVQSTSTYGRPQRILNLRSSCRGPAPRAWARRSRWRWWAGIRVAAETVRSSEVWAQAFDVELGEDAPRRGYVEPVRVWRSAREDPEGTHPPRGEQRARREGRVLRVRQHLVPHSELHVPPGGVELRLAPVLSLLQQRPHFRSHEPHQVRDSLAGPRWVGCSGGRPRARRTTAQSTPCRAGRPPVFGTRRAPPATSASSAASAASCAYPSRCAAPTPSRGPEAGRAAGPQARWHTRGDRSRPQVAKSPARRRRTRFGRRCAVGERRA